MDIKPTQSEPFYTSKSNVFDYIESCEGKDGRFIIEKLKTHLDPNSTVLELGMGAGKDLEILAETYKTTGSDYSQTFLDIFKEKYPNSDLLRIDAANIECNRKFDCVYSNKVLHHLTKPDLRKSLSLQRNLLNKNGILFHTFWRGAKINKFHDLSFIQYEIQELRSIVKDFEIIEINSYEDMNRDDSIYIILRP